MSGHDVIRTARLLCVLLLLGFLATPRAQIVITPDEVPQTPGDTFTYKYTTLLSPVNVGVQGGPQTWVFDTATFVGNFAACKL
ncbi:hypothetical protein FJY71_01570, partial [candidate division WOR-3 bacterium]|nr:hypothetical protein [candidate division WOR-3 bacterium]